MNEKVIEIFREKNCSIYAVHQNTGIAYTTLSEILNGKININKCAAETIYKLLLYFGCTMEEILNPTSLVANVSGHYRGVSYRWTPEEGGTVCLKVKENDGEKTIDAGRYYTQERFYTEYRQMTELLIDAYLMQKEAEAMLNDTIFFDA